MILYYCYIKYTIKRENIVLKNFIWNTSMIKEFLCTVFFFIKPNYPNNKSQKEIEQKMENRGYKKHIIGLSDPCWNGLMSKIRWNGLQVKAQLKKPWWKNQESSSTSDETPLWLTRTMKYLKIINFFCFLLVNKLTMLRNIIF